MSKHQCNVTGSNISFPIGFSTASVKEALKRFADSVGTNLDSDAIQLDKDAFLSFEINFYAYGAYKNEDVEALAQDLSAMKACRGVILCNDGDTADPDCARVAYGIGPDSVERELAVAEFHIDALQTAIDRRIDQSFFDNHVKRPLLSYIEQMARQSPEV